MTISTDTIIAARSLGDATESDRGRTKKVVLAAIDIVFLTIVVLLVYRDFIFGSDGLVIPSDGTEMLYPFEHYVANQLRSGQLPLWFPHLMSGFPAIGYPQYGLFYPVRWLFWLWPQRDGFSPTLFGADTVFHTWLSATAMYFLVVRIGWHRIAAVAAAVAWAIAPNALAYVGWANAMPAFAWWPLTLLFLLRAEQRNLKSWADISLAGICLGMTTLASPAQPAIQLILLICVVFLFYTKRSDWRLAPLAARVVAYGSIGLIGVGLAAVSLIPIFEFSQASVRFLGPFGAVNTLQRLPKAAFTYYHFGWKHVPGFVIYGLSRESAAFYVYLGPFLFLAAAIGCVASYRNRNIFGIMLASLMIFSILYAFNVGIPSVVYFLPVLNMIREPDYYASYILLSASLLAAYGIDQVLRRQMSRSVTLWTAVAGIASLAVLALTGWRPAGQAWHARPAAFDPSELIFLIVAAAWVLCFVLVRSKLAANFLATVFCGLIAWNLVAVSYPRSVTQASIVPPDLHETANDSGTNGGPLGDGQSIIDGRSLRSLAPPKGDPQRVMFYRGGKEANEPTWNPSIAAIAGFDDVFGLSNPVLKGPFQAFLWARLYKPMLTLLDIRTIATDASGVQAVEDTYGLNSSSESILKSVPMIGPNQTLMRSDVSLFRYDKGLGHAWLTTHYEVMNATPPSSGGALALIPELGRVLEPTFDLSTMTILDRTPETATPAIDPSGPPAAGEIHWLSYLPNSMELQVKSDRPAILTISEVSYPGWRAQINGRDVPVYKADGLLRAVTVPAGTSTVSFRYMPNSLLLGCLISGVAAAFAMILLAVSLVRRRRTR